MADKYKIIRMYSDDRSSRTIERGLTLEEAQAHCRDPKTSSRKEGKPKYITDRYGAKKRVDWFDGFDKE